MLTMQIGSFWLFFFCWLAVAYAGNEAIKPPAVQLSKATVAVIEQVGQDGAGAFICYLMLF